MIKISDKIYYLPHYEETDRPTLGYIKGEKYSLMIDAGETSKDVNLYLSELDKLNLPHPDFVSITHWHFDHSYGLSFLDATAIACKNTNDKLKQVNTWKWDEKSMSERVKNFEESKFSQEKRKRDFQDLNSIKVRPADIVFDKHLTLDLGGVTCEMMYVDTSHTHDCVLYFVPEEKVIFVGDAGYTNSPEKGQTYEKDKLQNFITCLESLDFEVLVNGHWSHESKESAMADYYEILESL